MPVTSFVGLRAQSETLWHVSTVIIANAAAGNAAGDLITEDAIIHEIIVTSEDDTIPQTQVTVQDRAGSPKKFAFGKNTVVGGGTSLMFESTRGTPTDGGLNITCNQTNSCSVKVVWRRPSGN